MRGINREQKDPVQQLFESDGWPWNVEVTNVCETESTALPICIQIVFTLNLLSLEIRQNSILSIADLADTKLRVNFMSVPSVIFMRWSDFQIFVMNQQRCDHVIL